MRGLLWVGKDRKESTLRKFFRKLGKRRSRRLQYICSDMWKPYLQVISEMAGDAVHVLDRFHAAANMSKAIDKVRTEEAEELKRKGYEPVLKHTRFCLLKRPENLTAKQEITLAALLKFNLRSVRSYLLKEDSQWFWGYVSPYFAGVFLDRWVTRALRSRIQPMMQIARSLRSSAPPTQLVSSSPLDRARRRRRPQQQAESDHQTCVWFSQLQEGRSRPLSRAWRPA